ncbi:hypothetical protein [Chitinophaga defluvii]|uniref:Uncharacterized protein n=1 Tax=Chitinophaga defluvii TaxID=3163343 RepID=A0ABV2T8S2_9BACT
MERLDTDHKYILELKMWNKQSFIRPDDPYRGLPVYTREHHHTLSDAFSSLLLVDIKAFEKYSDTVFSTGRHYESARIISADNEALILEVNIVPIQDVLAMDIPAGIYFSVSDQISSFEESANLDLSEFRFYEGDSNCLLIASYNYSFADGLVINIDHAYDKMVEKARTHESQRIFSEEEWKYQIKLTQQVGEHLDHIYKTSYHYPELKPALNDLLQVNLHLLDDNIVETENTEIWINEAVITEREGATLVGLITANYESNPSNVSEPGIHLQCYQTVEEFEKKYNVDLSALGNYGQNDNFLLLANYTGSYDSLIPTVAFKQLQRTLAGAESQANLDAESPVTLQIEWKVNTSQVANEITAPPDLISNMAFSTPVEALSYLVEQISTTDFQINIENAVLYKDGKEIMRLLKPEGEKTPLSNGVFIEVNPEHLSLDMLKVLVPHISKGWPQADTYFLIAGKGEEARRILTNNIRRIKPIGKGKGNKI